MEIWGVLILVGKIVERMVNSGIRIYLLLQTVLYSFLEILELEYVVDNDIPSFMALGKVSVKAKMDVLRVSENS